MFKIGDFSKFSRVSVKMLRHYDRLGLLKPHHVDWQTKYRYYSADQLPRLNRIIALKDLGFSLEQIGKVLNEDSALSAEQLEGMLALKQAEVEQLIQAETHRLNRISARLRQIQQERQSPYEVVSRQIAAQEVALWRRVVSESHEITAMFEAVEAHVAQFNARAFAPPVMLEHDTEFSEAGQREVSVAIPLNAAVEASDEISVQTLPALRPAACTIHVGNYGAIDNAFQALLTWIEVHGYTIKGDTRKVYLRFGADNAGYELPDVYLTDESALYVTEIQIPISR